MPSAFIFYTLLFLALLVVSAGLILVALLFLDHERQLWQRMAPVVDPIGWMVSRNSRVIAIGNRFPRVVGFLAHRLDPRDPWGSQGDECRCWFDSSKGHPKFLMVTCPLQTVPDIFPRSPSTWSMMDMQTKQIQRRANHRFPAAGRGRYADQRDRAKTRF